MTGVGSFLRQLVIGTQCDAQNSNHTWTVPVSNLGHCGVKPETNLLTFIQIIRKILVRASYRTDCKHYKDKQIHNH